MHITQSKQWGEFRKQTPNIKSVQIVNNCQIFFSKIPGGTVAYLPRVNFPRDASEIISVCKKEKAFFLKVEPLNEVKIGFEAKSILPRHTIYLDLRKSEINLLREMHEKTRYNIHLAEKKGVEVREDQDPEKFIELLNETEKRQGFFSHNPNYYRKLWKTLRPAKMVHILSAYPYAAIMLFNFDGMLYYPYGGSNPKYRELQSPSLLHWHAIMLGKKLKCQTYDLWGSYKNSPTEGDPWWGIYRFKKGFAGEEITFPASVDIPLSPLYHPLMLADRLRWKVLHLKR